MRILFITPEFITDGNLHNGGLATYIFKISKALIAIGHSVAVVMPGDKYNVIEYNGITTVIAETSNFKFENILSIITFGRLNRFWRWIFQSYGLNKGLKTYIQQEKVKVDIIQFSSYKAVALFAPKNIPFVIRISSLQRILESFEITKPGFSKLIVYKLEEYIIRYYKNVYGPGKYLVDLIKSELSLNKEIEILPTPIFKSIALNDSDLYNSFEKKLYKTKYILYFGTVSYLKGAKYLTAIINNVLSVHQELCFVIIGKSNDCPIHGKVIHYILNLLNEDVKDRVHYFPGLTRSNLTPFIENAKAIVIPSIIDNFPNTALEAMQYGKVVFASNRASLDNLIKDGINGYLCEYNNVIEYKTKISSFLNKSDKEINEMEFRVKESILDHSPINAAQKLVQYFMKVIGDK